MDCGETGAAEHFRTDRGCGLAGADGVEIVPPDDVVVWVEAKGAPERLPAGSEEGDAHEHALINRGGAQKIPRGR